MEFVAHVHCSAFPSRLRIPQVSNVPALAYTNYPIVFLEIETLSGLLGASLDTLPPDGAWLG